MSSLSDRLRALGVPTGDGEPRRTEPSTAQAIDAIVPGRFVETEFGPAFVAEQEHPVDRAHGCASLRPGDPLEAIAAWAGQSDLDRTGVQRFAYIDAETTGLARAAGTYAFLVGVGRYEGDTLQLAQFFLRDPAEEPAMLAALRDYLAPCEGLITFNGKTFDLPLLRARYVANRQAWGLADLPHLDLLSLARRLWRSRLPSRALSHLESDVLGVQREDQDTPGWLIPILYFDYLQDGDARPLAGVFYHNAVDLLSMAALLSHAAALLADPLRLDLPAPDRFDIGRLFEDIDRIEAAARLYARALEGDLDPHVRARAIRQWSYLEKRRQNLQDAVALWRQAAAEGQVYAHVELAMVSEHRERDYQAALAWTDAALAQLAAPDCPEAERGRWLDALQHRRSRLVQKIRKA
jgi:uncharacterized protein YprB with RNaseH-like and TPR domain